VKILFVHTFYKLQGGEDAVVQNEMDLLRRNGHEVELLSFSNTGGGLLKLLFMPYNPFSYRATKEKLKAFHPDIVHLHNLHFAASASVIRAIHHARIPMVMTIHNYRLLCPSGSLYHDNKLFLDSLKAEFPWAAVRKGVYKDSKIITFWLAFSNYLNRKTGTWQLVDKYVFLNGHSRRLFLDSTFNLEQQKTALKPNFAQETKIGPRPITNSYFLYVGRLTEEKGVFTLLEAFAASGAWLKIAGMGPMETTVKGFAMDNKNIEYLGQQSRSDIDQLLEKAEAVIFPSVWFETFGMIVVEAFAKGIPVITSDLGNMKILVTNGFNGLTFDPGNPADLKAKVKKFMDLPREEKRQMHENARETYELNFSPEDNVSRLLEIYSNLININKAPRRSSAL
jgi:glycosyltransferase involved in cell wall biosynthesis